MEQHHLDDGERLVHRFRVHHVEHLSALSSDEREALYEAVRQLGEAWGAHRTARTEQDRTRALREVDAAMAELDLLAERLTALHGDGELAEALRTLRI